MVSKFGVGQTVKSNFVVYTGKADGPVKNLGHKVVMEVCIDILKKGYEVYFDNYFSTVELAADLLKHGTTTVATTRPHRVGFPKETVNSAAVAGQSRGYSVSTILDNKIHCFVWLDKKPVFFIDTVCRHSFFEQIPQDDSESEPRVRHVTVRRGLTDGTRINVTCPAAVKAYNSNMGGVDLADQICRFYTSSHKSSRRWYLRLFWFLLDLAVDNAFILAKKEQYTIKQFREELATELIGKFHGQQ